MEVKNHRRPSKEQMAGFLEGDNETPIAMVNLLKFKKNAEYEDKHTSALINRCICTNLGQWQRQPRL